MSLLKVLSRPLAIMLFPILVLPLAAMSAIDEPGEETAQEARTPRTTTTLNRDFQTYIDANRLLMFVTNKGSFAFDNGVMLGKSDGLYYPYTGLADILNGSNRTTLIYAGSIWIGGVDAATGDTLVTSGQHDTDWGEGPLVGGAPVPGAISDPHYRVYKIYSDSLADNPNTDYLEWPADEGAPVDEKGRPDIRGDQTLWAVYNDLDAAAHSLAQGSEGLGIEVQQTVWAIDQSGELPLPSIPKLRVQQIGVSEGIEVEVVVVDREALTGHDYRVETDTAGDLAIWRLIDVTLASTLLDDQVTFAGNNSTITDGFLVQVTARNNSPIGSFQVVANGAGPVDLLEAGAAWWRDFPVPLDADPYGYPTENQQVGDGLWMIHTGDNGGSNGGGDRYPYSTWIERTFRGDAGRLSELGHYDWEIRFTGSNSNPGVNGSYAWDAYNTFESYWVPFELWRIGIDTPDDPSDDVRIIPWVLGDIWGDGSADNLIFDLTHYGADGSTCHDGCEHSVSGGDNDPYTDWVYWRVPMDDSPGQSGYLAFEAAMIADPQNWTGEENPVMDRMVLVNWNGGEVPPFTQDMPEMGTVFRLITNKTVLIDAFTFTAEAPPAITTGPEGASVYARFKMINKGGMTLNDFYFSVWFDPDLGDANDDFVGCDTLNDIFYCYNADDTDTQYGSPVPAVGAKFVEGPIVPSPGDVAYVEGVAVPDHKNLGMSSHNRYVNPYGPDTYVDTWRFMNGLFKDGSPLLDHNMQVTKYFGYGDPVTGTGFLDSDPADRRMMANIGPFTFYPNDTQQVVIKIAAGLGDNYLVSVDSLRSILNNAPPDPDWDGVHDPDDNCPNVYNPDQADGNANGIGDACDACCSGKVGDVNGAGGDNPTIGDVSLLIDALFISVDVSMLPCLAEADANLSGTNLNPPLGPEDITIGDLSLLIDLLFITVDLSLLEDCP